MSRPVRIDPTDVSVPIEVELTRKKFDGRCESVLIDANMIDSIILPYPVFKEQGFWDGLLNREKEVAYWQFEIISDGCRYFVKRETEQEAELSVDKLKKHAKRFNKEVVSYV